MTNSLSDKVLFATGAARGLCKAIVERFLQEGANVLAFDSHAENLATSSQDWNAGDQVIPRIGDVRNRQDIEAP
jgi:NADP-dependent 3-hydroxy acid dehydrogenase YdfG